VTSILDDLTTLPPKQLGKRLEQLANESLVCDAVTVFDGNADDGITIALHLHFPLHLEPRRRGDILDLARVVQDDARVQASCDWSMLAPDRRQACWRLLLRVSFERPVQCLFTVRFDIRAHPSDRLRAALPLLLAANRLVFVFDEREDSGRALVWIDAPVAREPVFDVLAAVGI